MIEPFPIPLAIIGGKFDLFQVNVFKTKDFKNIILIFKYYVNII